MLGTKAAKMDECFCIVDCVRPCPVRVCCTGSRTARLAHGSWRRGRRTAAEAAAGGTIVVGIPAGFDRLDPNVTTFSRVGNMTIHMTDPLVWQKEPGVYVPGLATEWEVNEDATEYRFKLRDDVTFHDGTPFNAEAVKFTFDRIVDPETKSQSAFSNIGPYKETEVVNDHEVIVRFNTGYAPFLDNLSGTTLVPVSPTAQQAVGNEDWGITDFVGTGPFMFESMVSQRRDRAGAQPRLQLGT